MTTAPDEGEATVVGLWRYPVKSMMGEELNAADIGPRGVLGDRAFALGDSADGKIVTAKNPRKWPRMFEYRAAYVERPRAGAPLPAVRITTPYGSEVVSSDNAIDRQLSDALGRAVTLRALDAPSREAVMAAAAGGGGMAEEYWPDMDGFRFRDTVTEFPLAQGTFFDATPLHLLSTSTIDALRKLYPGGRFEVRRFRPNIVVSVPGAEGFAEDAWLGRTLEVGDAQITVVAGCPRCVMTTLPQGDLPADPGILRTAAQHHAGNVGVYATVTRAGAVRRGDTVRLV